MTHGLIESPGLSHGLHGSLTILINVFAFGLRNVAAVNLYRSCAEFQLTPHLNTKRFAVGEGASKNPGVHRLKKFVLDVR